MNMPEVPYSNRELDQHFNEIKEFLVRIEAQTTRTNGRVTKIEAEYVERKDIIPLYQWSTYSKGAVAVLVAIVLPILGFLSYQVVTHLN